LLTAALHLEQPVPLTLQAFCAVPCLHVQIVRKDVTQLSW
jgi:hypothetical protein